jgi:RNA polymerase sigma-70 factor (ECF subfamily)
MEEQEQCALLRSAVEGDQDALQRLIVHYHDSLRATVAHQMGTTTRRRIDADDVLQGTYVAVFKTIQGLHFNGPASFYKWLETAALNELKDHNKALHRQKRDVTRELHSSVMAGTSYLGLASQLPCADSTPSRHVAKSEAVAALLSSLARLTDDQREVVRLRFLESKPVPEIATRLGKTEPAVHMLSHRGLRALEELMGSITQYLSGL